MKIVIVMPAYNAAKTIESVFDRIPKDFWHKIDHVLIVNDGSKDNLPEVIERIRKKYHKIGVLTHPQNRGYGAAQKTGFTEAVRLGADIAVLLHSDGQYAPEILQKMVDPIEQGVADVVLGSRMLGGMALKGGMPLYKYLGNRGLTMIENLAYGMRISEYHTGYMIYSRKALAAITFTRLSNTFHFDGEMIMMSGKKRLRIREVPIPTRYAEEKSNLKPIKYGIDVLKIIWRNWTGKYDF
jgi:glycosyltransferase involved in cell wall biosynthesis